ncbi:MAG: hypothetical protein NZ561_01805 [Phycisphaerae bacterium]|nr:hypothetical protein [Phycisphaerae bacterium]MDW8261828.1 hypothetical protein [Phycisphaerales bacterium]
MSPSLSSRLATRPQAMRVTAKLPGTNYDDLLSAPAPPRALQAWRNAARAILPAANRPFWPPAGPTGRSGVLVIWRD